MSITETDIADKLEPLGIVTGGLLVLIGLGTIIGMPWQTNDGTLVSFVQFLGILGTMAVGAGLVWLSRENE